VAARDRGAGGGGRTRRVALNDIDLAFGQHIETMTREELSEYIEDVLADAGIDVTALLERGGVDEAAGRWRDW
jgi:hypothetical protein